MMKNIFLISQGNYHNYFAVAKFNIELLFAQFLSDPSQLKIRIYIYIMFWNTKLIQNLDKMHGHVPTKMQQSCSENKFILGVRKL